MIVSSSAPSGPALWPVACGATRSPCSRAQCTAVATSRSSVGKAMAAGRWSTSRLNAWRAASQSGSPGATTRPVMAADKVAGVALVSMARRSCRCGAASIQALRRANIAAHPRRDPQDFVLGDP